MGMITYHIPTGIQTEVISGKPVVVFPGGGKILLDRAISSIWKNADGKSIQELQSENGSYPFPPEFRRFIIACLAEAGLLSRHGFSNPEKKPQAIEGPVISLVVVGHNSLEWLKRSLPSIEGQSYRKLEALIVDNASSDGTTAWVQENYPHYRIRRLERPTSLAEAINCGVGASLGEYYLLLNPDVELEPDAVSEMFEVARQNPDCAAVAAKLRFLWAPGFLNGLGNSVGGISWGMDNGLGHLDLGQFDSWREVPSACFAAALIPKSAWQAVGPIDEHFQLYYEDTEWSYRARLAGHSILAAPNAIIYHAFSGRIPSGREEVLDPQKLQRVVSGRLRFITKILGLRYFLEFFCGYLIEDTIRLLTAALRGRWKSLGAYFRGWRNYLSIFPELLAERKVIQSHRKRIDREILAIQNDLPLPLVWHGLPELTLDIVRTHYYPLLISGRLRQMPEFTGSDQLPALLEGTLTRLRAILREEGFGSLVFKIMRYLQWKIR